MNRILFEPAERNGDEAAFGGERARHVASVLRAKPGDTVRLGEVGGARYDSAEVLEASPTSCRVRLGPPLPPLPRARVDLLLALPRPKCLRRLWPQIAALGPARVYVTAAEKVEKDYWGASFLRPEVYRPLLLDGLAQAGDTILPAVETHRRLRPLLEDVLFERYPADRRYLAHPSHDGGADLPPPVDREPAGLIAVGPEGGWSAFELGLFDSCGFRRVSLGPRTLRTDTAVVALFAAL